MVRVACAISGILTLILSPLSLAADSDLRISGRNEIWDNPFVAYGVNQQTQMVTGYLMGSRIAPGATDECRLVFSGNLKNPNVFAAKYLSELDGFEKSGAMGTAILQSSGGQLQIKMKKDQMGTGCEWILPFINEPHVKEDNDEVEVSFGKLLSGKWTGVFAIRAKQASLYQKTEESSIQKAFLIQGDLVYVYNEKPGWYYVRYEGRKKATVGWIKKSDTVQIEFDRAGRQ